MNDELWKAIVNCETAFDGQYLYGVVTTKIFCRPSCRSRTPLREHVRIFQSIDEAKDTGFRPCKRCHPDKDTLGPDEELIQVAKNLIERHYQEPLTLGTLSLELAISPYHLHRLFKLLTGITPADYVRNKRIAAAKDLLKTRPSCTITDIALTVGFRRLSHFSSTFQQMTGYSPSQYRAFCLASDVAEEVKQ